MLICECGQSLIDSCGTILEGTFIEPVYGFRTYLKEDGREPVEVRPQRTFATRVYFSHYEVAQEEPFLPEGNPDPMAGINLQKRYSRYGMLTVINPGRMNRGFWLCPFCGYGDAVAGGRPEKHNTPWGSPCKGRLRQAFLGHEFQSDVLELRFIGGELANLDQGTWLSLSAALLAGAAKALDIERDDIDGTVLKFGGEGYRSIVLFDNVPGGAGHVRRIADNLQKVMEIALEIADNCPGCSRDQSCNACLRNYYNQYAHDLLKRGPVADFLRKVLSALYRQEGDGYFSLGLTDAGRWFEQQLRRADKIDLILDEIPTLYHDESTGKDWYGILYNAGTKGASVRLFIRQDLGQFLKTGPIAKVSLHGSITRLSEKTCVHFPHMIVLLQKEARHGTENRHSSQNYR